jgi:hypothetical protein
MTNRYHRKFHVRVSHHSRIRANETLCGLAARRVPNCTADEARRIAAPDMICRKCWKKLPDEPIVWHEVV